MDEEQRTVARQVEICRFDAASQCKEIREALGRIEVTPWHAMPGVLKDVEAKANALALNLVELERLTRPVPEPARLWMVEAIREAGGKEWDQIPDAADYLGRGPIPPTTASLWGIRPVPAEAVTGIDETLSRQSTITLEAIQLLGRFGRDADRLMTARATALATAETPGDGPVRVTAEHARRAIADVEATPGEPQYWKCIASYGRPSVDAAKRERVRADADGTPAEAIDRDLSLEESQAAWEMACEETEEMARGDAAARREMKR